MIGNILNNGNTHKKNPNFCQITPSTYLNNHYSWSNVVFVTRTVHNHCRCSFTVHSSYENERGVVCLKFSFETIVFEKELYLHRYFNNI